MTSAQRAAAPDPREFVTVEENGGRIVVTENAVDWARAIGKSEIYYSTVWAWPRQWIVNPDRTVEVRFGGLHDDTGRFGLAPGVAQRFAGKECGFEALAEAALEAITPHLDADALAFSAKWQALYLHAAIYNMAARNPHLRVLYDVCPLVGEAVVQRIIDQAHAALIKVEFNGWTINMPLPQWLNRMAQVSRDFTTRPLPGIIATLFDIPDDTGRAALKYLARNLPRDALGVGQDAYGNDRSEAWLADFGVIARSAAAMGDGAIETLKHLTTPHLWRIFLWYAQKSEVLAHAFAENPTAATRAHHRYFTEAHWSSFESRDTGDNTVVHEVKDFLDDPARAATVAGRSFSQILDASKRWHRELREAEQGTPPKVNRHFAPSPLDGVTIPARSAEDGTVTGPFTLRQLTTSADLVREGAQMHHCVARYSDKCHNGTSVIFSVQDETGTSLATAEFTSAYQLNQCLRDRDYGVSKALREMVADAPRLVEIREPYRSWEAFKAADPQAARRVMRQRQAAERALDASRSDSQGVA